VAPDAGVDPTAIPDGPVAAAVTSLAGDLDLRVPSLSADPAPCRGRARLLRQDDGLVLFLLSLLQRVRRHQIYNLLGLAGVAIVAGGLAFAAVERVSVGTGLYWAVTTASTVGYGDVTPHDPKGRVIAAVPGAATAI
jgi:hypothetical protein